MVINGEDALSSSSVNNAPEEPRKEESTSEYLKYKEIMSSGSEEARRIKQRIHECNEASQDQWRGIQSSTHIPIPNHG
jgi:hypothetical protein